MELKEGYKRTDVGLIPEGWDTPELGDILKSMQLGGNYKNSECETSWPLIKMGNIGRGTIKLDKLDFINSSQPPAIHDRLKEDDVLFNTRNTLDLVGKIAIWRNELPEAYFNSNIMRMEFNQAKVASKRFMNYILNNTQSLKRLRGIAIGTTSVAAIYSRDLVKIKIPLPTKAEQTAIANALSDADALVQSLTSLIAKKRQIKQGAMQTLLAGEKRLPGFSGKWEVKCIGEFTDCTSGGTPSTLMSHYWNGQIRWMNSGELNLKNVYDVEGRITEKGLRNSSTKLLPPKCVLVGLAGQGKTRGTVAMNQIQLCTNQSIAAILPNAAFNSEYLYYNLDSRYRELRELSTGDGGRGGLNLTIIRSLKVSFPKLPEQAAIATTLSDMDAEINALETKLTKYQQIKHGMMQNLLTGRIRLI